MQIRQIGGDLVVVAIKIIAKGQYNLFGGIDRGRAACGGLFERPFVSWRNDVALFMGPRLSGYSAVDVED